LISNYLLDLNVLIALTEPGHQHHAKAQSWFANLGESTWGICPLTEAGFIRVMSNPAMRAGTGTLDPSIAIQQCIAILQNLKIVPGFGYWQITETENWVRVTTPFAARISGHQQITDAYLLGLAIAKGGALVTFDRGLRFLAGSEFERNLLVLE